MDNAKQRKVARVVRDAIVGAAAEVEVVKEKTNKLAKRVGEKWVESKPLQRKAHDRVRSTAQDVVDFSKSVTQGVQEGVREVRKMM